MSRSGRIAFIAVASCLVAVGCAEDAGEVREWRPEDHQQPSQPDPSRVPAEAPSSAATLARAASALYRAQCSGCHGVDGQGAGPQAPPGAQMPDLTAAAFHDGRTDAQLTAVITQGRGMMPAFGDRINERGIAALVGHLRTLRR